MIDVIEYPKEETWEELLVRPSDDISKLESGVSEIIEQVKLRGDGAVKDYTRQFDGIIPETLAVPGEMIQESSTRVSEELKRAIETARLNIEKFHSFAAVNTKMMVTSPGIHCWQKTVPIEKVGLYVPGGTAPLISTVLMLGVPAVIAGCHEIVLCTPPDQQGNVHPAILYTAASLGINRIFRVGGVQAIAAMAYGSESIPRVYKIFGPGNQYVTVAKQLVAKDAVAIDLPAGPSELAVIADGSADPAYVASDLLSQAEHGHDSQVLLISCDRELLDAVNRELIGQSEDLPRRQTALAVLQNSRMFLLEDDEQMIRLANLYAAEHLIVNTVNYKEIGDRIINAGSVFLGPFAPESAGDYASGTNHTLPTNGTARAFSGVSLESFQKKISYQEISRYGLYNIGKAVMLLAEAEGLKAHSNAVDIRLRDMNKMDGDNV